MCLSHTFHSYLLMNTYTLFRIAMTPNWSEHVLEHSSKIYSQKFGDYHNYGHGVFGTIGIRRNVSHDKTVPKM